MAQQGDSCAFLVPKKQILLLQNITLQTGNPSTNVEQMEQEPDCKNISAFQNSSKENCDPKVKPNQIIKKREHRCTASSYIFDEVPVFSDSDEENEFSKLITQKNFPQQNETSENVNAIRDVMDNCALCSEELKLVDILQKCASINVDKVNNDFKKLINLCKELQLKYGKYSQLPSQIYRKNDVENLVVNDTSIENILNKENISPNLPLLTSVSNTESQAVKETFLPSKNGNSGGNSSSGFSEEGTSDSINILNIDSIIKSIDCNEIKEKMPRRSSRLRKPRNFSRCTSLITEALSRKETSVVKLVDLTKKINKKDAKNKQEIKEDSSRKYKKGSTKLPLLNVDCKWNLSLDAAKARRLYSPDRWMRSKELMDLCKVEERRST